jgi:hypothetical protein
MHNPLYADWCFGARMDQQHAVSTMTKFNLHTTETTSRVALTV